MCVSARNAVSHAISTASVASVWIRSRAATRERGLVPVAVDDAEERVERAFQQRHACVDEAVLLQCSARQTREPLTLAALRQRSERPRGRVAHPGGRRCVSVTVPTACVCGCAARDAMIPWSARSRAMPSLCPVYDAG